MLNISTPNVGKVVMYNALGAKCMEYINETLLPNLTFVAPNVAGMYWLQVHYTNSPSQHSKIVSGLHGLITSNWVLQHNSALGLAKCA